MHVVKQVVQQSSGSGRSFFIGSGRNRNPQKSRIRPELSSGAPLPMTRKFLLRDVKEYLKL